MSPYSGEKTNVKVVGGGLAGSEAAWQLAKRGIAVTLFEMRPEVMTPAHRTGHLGELVCSNSLKAVRKDNASGILKKELELGKSLILEAAYESRVPAGGALAVDRQLMGEKITNAIENHPNIELRRELIQSIPQQPAIIATGPLTEGLLADDLSSSAGVPLYFYDAIAPIIETDTLDDNHTFVASRWDEKKKNTSDPLKTERDTTPSTSPEKPKQGDYINCPLSREEYETFVEDLLTADKVPPHHFEEPKYFEGCLPIEVMAARGPEVLRYGPMRPVGLRDPKTGRRPYAVLQLRAENSQGTAHNMVGFQTRLRYPEQKRIFKKIPALRNVNFLRLGSIHRNTYLRAPDCLNEGFALKQAHGVRVTGLLCGVEGYMESTAMGWLTGVMTASELNNGNLGEPPPVTTATGSLYAYIRRPRMKDEPFAPTNMNMSLLPPLDSPEKKIKKNQRRLLTAERAEEDFKNWLECLKV